MNRDTELGEEEKPLKQTKAECVGRRDFMKKGMASYVKCTEPCEGLQNGGSEPRSSVTLEDSA